MVLVRKLKLAIVNEDIDVRNEQYRFIRNEQYEQYRAMNLGMTLLATNNILNSYNGGEEKKIENQIGKLKAGNNKLEKEIAKKRTSLKKEKSEEKILKLENEIINKEKAISLNNSEITKLQDEYKRCEVIRSDIDSNFKKMYIDELYTVLQTRVNFKHKDNMSLVTQRIKNDYSTALKNGMARGERSLTSYKRDFPLLTRGRDLKFYEKDRDIFIKWVEGIVFKVIIGRKDKDRDELLHTLYLIIRHQEDKNDYKVCDSSISIGDDLILNLTLDIKPVENKLDFVPNRVVGVDMGIAIPAYASLNDLHYKKYAIGSYDGYMKANKQFRARRKEQQRALKSVKGGRGRKDKLKALEHFSDKQSRYNKNYNHFVSKEIIKFALDNKAGQINIELLSMKEATKGSLLGDWGYFQLRTMIEEKAKKYGIIVKTVDPYLTSQICSKCGHYEEGQREEQADFTCKQCGFKTNADYNASRNIAMSKKYIDKKEQSEYNKVIELNKAN